MQNNVLRNITFLTSINATTDIVRDNQTGQLLLRRVTAAETYPVLCAIAQVQHPNLMAVLDVRMMHDRCVSLCEYINGTTLEYRVENGGVLPVSEAKAILCQVCDGLTALHQNGIIHRDVKPSNVMLTNDGTVKLIDFDISRLNKPMQTRDTTILGTEGYAAPEQFGFAQTGARADIYACGVLLNYLLTGRLPNERLYQGALTAVILQCTEMDESKRFQSAAELKQMLQGRKINRRRTFQPLPGFRSKHVLPKILTVLLMIVWGFVLLLYLTGGDILYGHGIEWTMGHIKMALVLLLFWSALPYVLFGDVFRLSEKINPDNPQNGKYVLRILGAASFAVGVVLLLFV